MMTILEVNNITKRYKNNRGVFDINFSLEQGEIFGLLGSNGTGKTTIMKMITGLLRPDKGSISVFNHDMKSGKSRVDAIDEMGSLIEMPSFYSYMSASENLQLALNYYPNLQCGKSWIDEILDMVGLLPYRRERVKNFSLGMKQRLGIALAMIGNPKLYILDEPSNGLDIEGRVEVRNILKKIATTQKSTILISSHLSEEIEKLCTTVGIMKDGMLYKTEKMNVILSMYPNLETYYLEQVQGNGILAERMS